MSALNKIKKIIPKSIRPQIKSLSFHLFEVSDRLIKGRKNLIPPMSIQYVGGKDQFLSAGQEFFEYFKTLGHLKPNHSVLDIGCGTGRMAYPLTEYLSQDGHFSGFDIVPHAVKWCRLRYEHQFQNFRFYNADIFNSDYNPKGKISGESYRFIHRNSEFDFIFATSVFTHMLPKESQNYLNEIRRVMKPTGRALLTFFVLNQESQSQISLGNAKIDLKHKMDGFYTADPECPEVAIGYDQVELIQMLKEADLEIEDNIHFGSWCAREKYLSFQDVVIVRPVAH